MKKTLVLLFFGIFLTGCYTNSLTMVGPATGVASGKLTETATSTTINHIVKKKTGKNSLTLVKEEIEKKEAERSLQKELRLLVEKRIKITRQKLDLGKINQ